MATLYLLDTNILAAAAHVTGATLLTTDRDFLHLDDTFLACECIPSTVGGD